MAKKRPLVELEVSEVDSLTPAVKATALVDQPAIEEAWMIFGKQQEQKPFEFATASEERRLVMGPAMIPDLPIYRCDESGEMDVFFRKSTIEKIIKKWGKAGFHNCFNLMHDPEKPTTGVYLFESIMVDKERGIKTPSVFKKEYNDGTWIITLFVEDDVLWEEYIKTGRLQGFSVEGFFNMVFSKSAQATCKSCQKEFDYNKTHEVAMGAVCCPDCGAINTQNSIEEEALSLSAMARLAEVL